MLRRVERERETFLAEVKVDPSLKTCRDLAEKGSRGYLWKNGLLIQSIVDETVGDSEVIVVPKCKRTTILKVAYDRLGHLGYRKVLSIIRRNFVWPRLAADVKAYCESCTECQKRQ